MLTVHRATEVTDELVTAVAGLLPQLSASAPAPTRAEIEEIVGSPATALFVARDGDGGRIVGTLTLALFRIPSGVRAWIEDVIVDESVRGQGGGEALTAAALEAARAAGARTVELTSRPTRQAANRLYQRLGFVTRQTNVYRYDVGGRP
ncbi:MAG TPA: GNAT family N-acetyltransferase [Acidimicrobiales bacterium]|nr:GNAT family N-acetyltransferase [Acidimicrobiales bacterium]